MDRDIFQHLLRAIISQQLSTKVAEVIRGRFLKLCKQDPKNILKLDEEKIRKAGLSRQKIKYIKNVAQFFVEHKLDKWQAKDWETKSDKEIIELLTQIAGVGEWTVQMILMFSLERPDVFPVNDLGIQLGFAKMYELQDLRLKDKKKFLQIMQDTADAEAKGERSKFAKSLWKHNDVGK